jgi:hypothetical protein
MGGQDPGYQALITKSLTAVGQTMDITSPNGATAIVQVNGVWSGGSLTVEGSNDGASYDPILLLDRSTNLVVNSISSNGFYTANTNGFQFLQIRVSTLVSGTAVVNVYGSDATSFDSNVDLIRGGTDGTLIGNTGNALNVTNVSSSSTSGLDIKYNEVSSIVSGSETNVISFTASGSGYRVSKIYVAGENIALFKVKLNGTTICAKRTFFGNLNEEFNFEDFVNGLKLVSTDQIVVTVLHNRPWSGNFESTIMGINL